MLGHHRLMAFLDTTDGAGVAWFKDPDGSVLSVTQS
jgi:hypothetical protein